MELAIIPLSRLPDLETLTGAYGSLINPAQMQANDDALVVVMVFVYDLMQMF